LEMRSDLAAPAGESADTLPRSTIIAIAVAVAGGVVLIGIVVLLGMLWCADKPSII
jgi:hypothetical protein